MATKRGVVSRAPAVSVKIPSTPLHLSRDEARGLMLAAQGLLHTPTQAPTTASLQAMIERLGVVQIDTISVVERSQYLVLWSRLGAYPPALFDDLLYPHRAIFEYWSHAASILPMADYAYYRAAMLGVVSQHPWPGTDAWMQGNPEVIQRTLDTIRERGPLTSAEFERPVGAARTGPWDWYGPKDSRRALDVLWTHGDLMVHSRRGGQKRYDLRERVVAEAFGAQPPRDDALPSPDEHLRHFVRRTVQALGVLVPSWLWDYFRLRSTIHVSVLGDERVRGRLTAQQLLDAMVREVPADAPGALVPATIEGLSEPAYVARERLADLARLRGGERPSHTTLLSPFDSLIWDRARARALFDYEVCFEAYVVPEKRRYGYYCLAILHHGGLVGRLDAKAHRAARSLLVRALYLEPGVTVSPSLLDGLSAALRDLARFLGLQTIAVERSTPETLAAPLQERLEAAQLR